MSPALDILRLIQSPLALQAMLTACFIFCVGIIVASHERASLESLAFFKLTATIGLWLFGFAWMYVAADEQAAYGWAKIGYIGLALLPPAAFEISAMAMQDYWILRKKIQAVWITGVLVLIAVVATDFAFGSMYRFKWGFYPRYHSSSALFVLYFFGILSVVLVRYVKLYRLNRIRLLSGKKARLIVLAYLTSNLALVDFLPSLGVASYPCGYVFIILFAIMLAYSFWRYHLVSIAPALPIEQIITIMNDGLLMIDSDDVIRVVNPVLCRMLNVDASLLTGMRLSEVLTEASGFGSRLEQALNSGELQNFEIEYRADSEKALTFSLMSSFMRDTRGEPIATVCLIRDITERKQAEVEREAMIADLQRALENVKTLSGMLPICATCKKIRDDQGYWQQIECYVRDRSQAEFSHGICPECAQKAFAELEAYKPEG